jgi:CRP-like cAMP-binding protein
MDEAHVATMPRAAFLEFLRGSVQWGLNFVRMVSDRLFVAERDLAALSRTWTRPRLEHLLLKLADNLGEPALEGTVIRVPVTHEALASMIGASRVRVTSTLSQLQREGLLSKRGRLLVVRTDKLKSAMAQKGD